MATPTDVSDNVLIIGGSDIFTDKFMNPLYIPQDAQNDAVEHLLLDRTILLIPAI